MQKSFEYCTRCNKPFSDIRINVKFIMNVDRKRLDNIWEQDGNATDVSTSEIICQDCFNKFTKKMGELNEKQKNWDDIASSEEYGE